MQLKSIKLKWIVASVAGLVFAGFAAVVVFIAIQMGLSWPVVHRVDQGNVPDMIYVKVEDFIDDSGYVASVSYESCCSDKVFCSWPIEDAVKIRINRGQNFAAIPIRWASRSMCPYKVLSLSIGTLTGNAYYSFSADSTSAAFPKLINTNCWRIEQEDSTQFSKAEQEKLKKCPNEQFALPRRNDTLVIRRIQL
jgi:hypothetical protein